MNYFIINAKLRKSLFQLYRPSRNSKAFNFCLLIDLRDLTVSYNEIVFYNIFVFLLCRNKLIKKIMRDFFFIN